MKRRITLSIALVLSVVLASLMSSDSTAKAQQTRRIFRADTGIMFLAPGQKLRLTVNAGAGNDTINVRFKKIGYTEETCTGRVCKLTVASQSTTNPIMLASGEGAFFDIFVSEGDAVRGVVLSNSPNVVVNGSIVGADGATVSTFALEIDADMEIHS